MKKAIIFVLLYGLVTAVLFAEEYTIYYSGDDQGTVTVNKDARGKITITCQTARKNDVFFIDHDICPLIPEKSEGFLLSRGDYAVIDGNTSTETNSNGAWIKTVVNGNTTTKTNSGGFWEKKVVNGNTTTTTDSDGFWDKTVVNGNTTTWTDSYGHWEKTVVNGNTTTRTDSDGDWDKTVVNGNTTTRTDSYGDWEKTVITREKNNIYVNITTGG